MKSVSDVKLSYLVKKIMERITALSNNKSNADHTHRFGAAERIGGIAGKATQLEAVRNFQVDLEGKGNWSGFDGTSNCVPGVSGILQPANGGTGVTSINDLKSQLGLLKVYRLPYQGDGQASRSFSFPGINELLCIIIQPEESIVDDTLIAIKGVTKIGRYDNVGNSWQGYRTIEFKNGICTISENSDYGSTSYSYILNTDKVNYVAIGIGY